MSHNNYSEGPGFRLIHEILAARELNQPDSIAYTFLQDGESITEQLSYRELGTRSRKLARYLQSKELAGERCLILLNSSIDYVVAFLGCILAGVIAVPAYPPRPNKVDDRLRSMLVDSGAQIIIAAEDMLEKIESSFEDVDALRHCDIIAVNPAIQGISDVEAAYPADFQNISENAIAYLQYTSGSTGAPKGVMVSHKNLIRNIYLIKHTSEITDPAVHVTWLPIFHDFGLVNGICHPLYAGQHCVFMPPVAFTQNPLRWLKAISDFGGSVSGAPNFAYEYCVERITEEEISFLDLSCWEVAFSGAEPVRPDTLNAFIQKFSACGLRENVFCPAYGLAEATLYVSTIAASRPCNIREFDKTALEGNEVKLPRGKENSRALVSCGSAQSGQQIIIVDPNTKKLCAQNQVGEIWVCDNSIPCGYWNKPKETQETFGNYIDLPTTKNAGPFLRTGDMGFLDENELFIVSRLKDLIIIRGANHYPQDIEFSAERAHEALRVGGVAAFSVTTSAGQEGLVIVHEIERQWRKTFDGAEIADRIRRQIAEKHDLEIHELVLISPASIAKTTSGKIQRRLCREQFLAEELATLYRWQNPKSQRNETSISDTVKTTTGRSDIVDFLATCIARESGRSTHDISMDASLADFGLGSLSIVRISGELERKFKIRVSPTCAYDYPVLQKLADYLFSIIEPSTSLADDQAIDSSHAIKKQESDTNEAIAIVGMSCRLPGSNNVAEFWQLLKEGQHAITSTASRWQTTPGTAADFAGLLHEVDKFDAGFFGIPTREATEIDPQQRLMLELSWEALESACIPPVSLAETNTGVFIGISTRDYSQLHNTYSAVPNAYSGSGNAASICANRLSYFYNLHGPSMSVDTACSSSLVALHQACHAIKRGECSTAIVGGVNMILASELSEIFTQANMLSPDGSCKTFDSSANGYVRGEGGGVVVIKSLSSAMADGDPVLAVIRGTAINQDGRTNGLTAPNGISQQQVIKAALHNAGLAIQDINYVEAHGTGTPLGDPIEFNALAGLIDTDTISQPCLVGSVKTNIGHLEAAAGIAGLIKVVLSLQHELIPKHRNFSTPNPLLIQSPNIQVASEATPWPRSSKPRNAGLSSFGFGGTNAHVILGEPPLPIEPTPTNLRPELIAISARSSQAFTNTLERYKAWAENAPAETNYPVSFSSLLGREHFDFRAAIVINPGESLAEKLSGIRAQHAQHNAPLAWLFSGQGSQYAGMGEDLLAHSPIYAHYFNECSLIIEGLTGKSLHECLYGNSETNNKFLSQPVFTQAAIFSLEYALAKTYLQLGLRPQVLSGHSIGEYAVAAISGIFTAENALKMLVFRARAMEALSDHGGMRSLDISRKALQELIEAASPSVDIAASNSNNQQVISGGTQALEEFSAYVEKRGIAAIPLTVTHAFHSRLLEPIAQKVLLFFKSISFSKPNLPIVSSKTGCMVSDEMSCAEYWVEQMLKPVEFCKAINVIKTLYPAAVLLEIGAKPTLSSLVKQDYRDAICIPSLRERGSAYEQWLKSLAQLYSYNLNIDFAPLFDNRRVPTQHLPTYGFERNRYWLTAGDLGSKPNNVNGMFELENLSLANSEKSYFNVPLTATEREWVKGHQLFGRGLFPATGYTEILSHILNNEYGHTSYELCDFVISEPLFIEESGRARLQFEIQPLAELEGSAAYYVNCYSSNGDKQPWQLHLSLEVKTATKNNPVRHTKSLIGEYQEACTTAVPLKDFYENYAEKGLSYGNHFQLIESLWTDGSEKFVAYLKPGERPGELVAELLDACAQMIGGCASNEDLWLPVAIDSLSIMAPLHGPLVSIANIDYRLDTQLGAHVLIYSNGQLVIEIQGLRLAKASPAQFSKKPGKPLSHRLEWFPAVYPENPPQFRQVFLLGNNNELNSTLAESCRMQHMLCKQYFLSSLDIQETEAHVLSALSNSQEMETLIVINCLDYPVDDTSPYLGLEGFLPKLTQPLKNILIQTGTNALSVALLTRNALCGENDTPDLQGMNFSPLTGLVKTLNAEHESVNFCLIDLPVDEPATEQCGKILHAFDFCPSENLVRIRNNQLTLQRLVVAPQQSIQKAFEAEQDAWHLISGGLGDLGFATAEWLIEQGANHLILIGRSTPSDIILKKITQLQNSGIQIKHFSADVTRQESLMPVFNFINESSIPLRGVVQAAGALQDAPFIKLKTEDFVKVMQPKIAGTWNLFLLSQKYPLDYFVCYSSIASALGTQAQANYALANAFLDYFCYWGNQKNIYTSAINWGPWDEYGMAIKSGVLAYAEMRGIDALAPVDGFFELGRHLASRSKSTLIANANWEKFNSVSATEHIASLLKKLLPTQEESQVTSNSGHDFIQHLQGADVTEQKAQLADYLYQLLNSSFAAISPSEDFESLVPAQLGMDSLMSIELRNIIKRQLRVDVPVQMFVSGSSIGEIISFIISRLALDQITSSAEQSLTEVEEFTI